MTRRCSYAALRARKITAAANLVEVSTLSGLPQHIQIVVVLEY